MQRSITQALFDHDVDQLVLLWHRAHLSGDEETIQVIREAIPSICNYHNLNCRRNASFQELVDKYDEMLFQSVRGGTLARLGFFIREKDMARVNYALKHGATPTMGAEIAATHGDLEFVNYFVRKGANVKTSSAVCSAAASEGHLDILRWAHEKGYFWDKHTTASAAFGGHLKVLKWLHKNGCPWDETTCSAAAKGGHLKVLQWVRKKGCPWDEWTCFFAAEEGHTKVLQWAIKNGCPQG